MLGKSLFLVLWAVGVLSAAEVTIVDEIIAKVNGEIITRNDMDKARRTMIDNLRQQGLTGIRLENAIKEGESGILRERIDTLLLLSKAKEINLSVDSEVNKQLGELQRVSKIAEPEQFQEFVRQQTGLPYEEYKSEMKNQMLTNRVVRQEVGGKIQFRRDELMKYYEEHKAEFQREDRVFLREIMVAVQGASTADAEKKAKDLSTRGKKGEKFDELATANSDSDSAKQGGDIGAYEKGKLRPELEAAVWSQPKGYVTDPINLGAGFLILKVESHEKAGLADFEEVQGEVTNRLFQPRFQPEVQKYLQQLRVDAFLEIKPGFKDAGAAPGKNTAWVDPASIQAETTTKEEVAAQTRRRRLLGMVPIPGTSTQNTGTSQSR